MIEQDDLERSARDLFPEGTTPAEAIQDIADGFADEGARGGVTLSMTETLIHATALRQIGAQVARLEMRLGMRRVAWAPGNDNGNGV